MAIETGKKAKEFTAFSGSGKKITLSDFKGKWIVLYFYPKDNTSGCTEEACSFRDNMGRITKSGAIVIGVSPDSVKSHDGFKEKYSLNFILVSDEEKSICKAYDVLGEKSLYGRKYIGVIRSTYIIDAQGIVRHVFSNVKVDGHVDEVIAKLKELH